MAENLAKKHLGTSIEEDGNEADAGFKKKLEKQKKLDQ
jgi:hypothetical protein